MYVRCAGLECPRLVCRVGWRGGAMEDLRKRVEALEEGLKKTCTLALATDRDVQRERARFWR